MPVRRRNGAESFLLVFIFQGIRKQRLRNNASKALLQLRSRRIFKLLNCMSDIIKIE